jgi:PAS domain S-box-containing protein
MLSRMPLSHAHTTFGAAFMQADLILHYYAAILDQFDEGIFISDAAGTTLYVNKAYERITGTRRENLVGRTVLSLIEDGFFNTALNPDIVASKQAASRMQELGGGQKTVHLRGMPVLDDKGEVALVVTYVRDVTLTTELTEKIAGQQKFIEQYQGKIPKLGKERTSRYFFGSPAMRHVLDSLDTISGTDATIMLLGETGVGKDVLAHYIHEHSKRRDKLFLKVDCGGISESLIESELFGYMRGAFTGAGTSGRVGYFEAANGGTLFLDEIGELPLSMQPKLLRAVQDGEVVRVGSSLPRKVDVRIIAATHRNLPEYIVQGKFRQDLFYRLNVTSVQVPPLRERPEDIRHLAEFFLRVYAEKYEKDIIFSPAALHSLQLYAWPGNIRELQNAVQSLVITAKGKSVAPADLPRHIRRNDAAELMPARDLPPVCDGRATSLKTIMEELEGKVISAAVERCGSLTAAAKALGVDRTTLYRKLHGKKNGS